MDKPDRQDPWTVEAIQKNLSPCSVRKRDDRDAIVIELLLGLTYRQAHIKQYHLEQALRLLCEDTWVDRAKKHFGWQDGAAS